MQPAGWELDGRLAWAPTAAPALNAARPRTVTAAAAEGTPGMLTQVAGGLTGSAAIFDADWDAGLPGNLAAGARLCGCLLLYCLRLPCVAMTACGC